MAISYQNVGQLQIQSFYPNLTAPEILVSIKKTKKKWTDVNIHATMTTATESHTLGLQNTPNEHLLQVDMATQRRTESESSGFWWPRPAWNASWAVVCLSSADLMTSLKERLPTWPWERWEFTHLAGPLISPQITNSGKWTIRPLCPWQQLLHAHIF